MLIEFLVHASLKCSTRYSSTNNLFIWCFV